MLTPVDQELTVEELNQLTMEPGNGRVECQFGKCHSKADNPGALSEAQGDLENQASGIDKKQCEVALELLLKNNDDSR